jgi:spermidine synthase
MASAGIDKAHSPLRIFGFLELALGVSVGLLGVVTHLAPALFGRLLWTLAGLTGGAFGPSTVIAEFLISALLITVPTVLMGATFPAAVKVSAASATHAAEGTGRVYAANTAGGIAGALLGGFVLIPLFGGRNSLAVIGLIFLVNGLVLLRKSDGTRVLATRAVAIPLASGVAAFAGILLLPEQIVINFNQQQTTHPDVVYHGEGISHTIDIVRNQQNDVIMMVDGNIEADTSYLQRRHFILKGHLPLLLHPRPKDVAVVGLGLGITLSATANHPGIEAIQVIELTPEMLEAHAHIEDVTHGVLHRPNVSVRIDDGRNFLAMSDRTFDMITADPIHPRISGVGYLYTTEYYESVKRRLRPQGIVCQWMPMYAISKVSFDVAFRSFAAVFPEASFWYVRGHGLFVAGRDRFRIDYPELARRFSDAGVAADLASIRIDSPAALLAHMLMGPRDIEKYLASQPRPLANTDDNAYLEYHTPAEFLQPTEAILSGLLPFARLDDSVMAGLSAGEKAAVLRFWNARRAEILPEIRRTDFKSPIIDGRP